MGGREGGRSEQLNPAPDYVGRCRGRHTTLELRPLRETHTRTHLMTLTEQDGIMCNRDTWRPYLFRSVGGWMSFRMLAREGMGAGVDRYQVIRKSCASRDQQLLSE